jgi:hypothetical protein
MIGFLKPLYYWYAVLTSVLPILYWMVDSSLNHLFKIFTYLTILLMILVVVRMRFILDVWQIKFIALYSLLVISLGILINPITKATFAHLQPFVLIIFGVSFGYLIALHRGEVLNKIYQVSFRLGVVLSVIVIIYFSLIQMAYITYYGASSLLIIPIIWAMLEKKIFFLVFFSVILLLTGKRSSILAALIVFLIFMYQNMGFKNSLLLILGVSSIGFVFIEFDLSVFSRFRLISESLFQFEIDFDLLNTATSGRIVDLIAAFESINSHWLYWIFGKGIGAVFTVPTSEFGVVWETHYTHFTPLSYVFLGGGVLFILVYSYLINLLVYCLKSSFNFYNLLFIYNFLLSFFGGAIYFSDPFIWIFIGVVAFNKKYKIQHAGNFYKN